MALTLAELFSGGGGWSEAAKMSGEIVPIWHCDNDKNKIARYELRHPNVPNLGDIRNITAAPYADVWCISFPCTGISSAGKGQGLEDKGSRLWFEAIRLVGGARPRYVVIENSPNLVIRGLPTILGGLAECGYYAEWACLSGTQFGIQQRRRRLYLIANTDESMFESQRREGVLFRKIQTGSGLPPMPVYPGWRERRDIPQPRSIRSANDVPDLIHRLECVGDAIIPLIGMYIFECIKLHNASLHNALTR